MTNTSAPVAVDLPDSTSAITLESSDFSHGVAGAADQDAEQWLLEGLDHTGSVVFTTEPTDDLPSDKVRASYEVGSYDLAGVAKIRARHASVSESAFNSVVAVSATFVPAAGCDGVAPLSGGNAEWGSETISIEVPAGHVVWLSVEFTVLETVIDPVLAVSDELEGWISGVPDLGRELAPDSYPLALGAAPPSGAVAGDDAVGELRLLSGATEVASIQIVIEAAGIDADLAETEPALPAPNRVSTSDGVDYVTDELVVAVGLESPEPLAVARAAVAEVNGEFIGAVPDARLYQVRVPEVADLAELEELQAQVELLPGVESVTLHTLSEAPSKKVENAAVPGRPGYLDDVAKVRALVAAAGDGSRVVDMAWNAAVSGCAYVDRVMAVARAEGHDVLWVRSAGSDGCRAAEFATDYLAVVSANPMAAQRVTGVASELYSAVPSLTAAQVKECLIRASGDQPVPGTSNGVVDRAAALACSASDPLGLPVMVDVMFALDLTGSMAGELSQVKAEAATIVASLEELAPSTDFRFGVVSFEDSSGFFDSRGCGSSYLNSYGTEGDVPYRLDQSLVANPAAIEAAIEGLELGNGSDGPESYGRVIWELAQADQAAALGWRDGALRLTAMFGDNIPHSPELHEGFGSSRPVPAGLPADTGREPGRDGVVCTVDDISFRHALDVFKASMNRLLYVDSSGAGFVRDAWQVWAARTGGAVAIADTDGVPLDGASLTETIAELIRASGR